jgi:Domain of unknown function (DUF1127)
MHLCAIGAVLQFAQRIASEVRVVSRYHLSPHPSHVVGVGLLPEQSVQASDYFTVRRFMARRELASLDERMLRDIGLDPGVVDYEASQSFWRPARA